MTDKLDNTIDSKLEEKKPYTMLPVAKLTIECQFSHPSILTMHELNSLVPNLLFRVSKILLDFTLELLSII